MFEEYIKKMTKKERDEAFYYKKMIDDLFSFHKETNEWDLIFIKKWGINYGYHALIVNKRRLSQQNDFIFSMNGYDNLDFFLFSLIELYFKKLLYRNQVSICISSSSIKVGTCLLYNKAINKNYSQIKRKIKKEYIVKAFNLNDKQIENLCKKLNVSFDAQLFEDIDVVYETKKINLEFKQRVMSTDWKTFLFSLLPEKEFTDFPIIINCDKRVKKLYGRYYAGNDKNEKIVLYLFPHDNKWNQLVNTVIHEFCHYLEHCGIFSHYKSMGEKTHIPLFYAAIDILQNKSVLMGINLSDEIYDLTHWEEKCSVEELIILCNDLDVDYQVIKKLKPKLCVNQY